MQTGPISVSVEEQRSFGHLANLSSPLLEKLREAVELVATASNAEVMPAQCKTFAGESAGWPQPDRGFMSWDAETRSLSIAFKVECDGRYDQPGIDRKKRLQEFLSCPVVPVPWLKDLAPGARVHSEVFKLFSDIGAEGQGLAENIQIATGGVTPRRIMAVGYCVAGMLATIASLWLATRFPTADVRCITFGAQKVGNPEFAQTFRWLVGLSYRVVYRADPVPYNKTKNKNMLGQEELVHVHGEIFCDATSCRPGMMTWPGDLSPDYEDHSLTRYQQALSRRFSAEEHRDAEFQRTLQSNPSDLSSWSEGTDTIMEDVTAQSGVLLQGRAGSQPAEPQETWHRNSDAAGAADSLSGQPTSTGRPAALDSSQPSLIGRESGDLSMPSLPHMQSLTSLSKASVSLERVSMPDAREMRDLEEQQEALQASMGLGPATEKTADKNSMLGQMLIAGKVGQAAVLAAAAYKDEARYRKVTGIKKTRLVIDRNARNTHVHVSWLDDGTAVFAFRGTATMQDSLADVKVLRLDVHFLKELFPGARAHSGFLQQFVGVCQPHKPHHDLAAVLMQLSGGKAPTRVICTGHSLGGALATLGAAWAALQWSKADVRCITFGSPRVANRSFKRAFHSLVGCSLRLVYGRDPVPTLPPSIAYHHVQGAIHITPAGLIKLRSRPWHYKLVPSLGHHGMSHYHAGMVLHLPAFLERRPIFHLAGKAIDTVSAEAHAVNSLLHPHSHKGGDAVDGEDFENENMLHGRSSSRFLWRCLPLCTDT
ncbi:hypothetical protein WJX73_004505 [Symbiochloris irregularis]|uniref:Fungal lipase-type domain-containing protein n=1 Tax=Symbiochloris irregularis TaxID=706552 RepID=A0AAW1Q0V5_9CHLO